MRFFRLTDLGILRRHADWADGVSYYPAKHECPKNPEHDISHSGRQGPLTVELPTADTDDFVWTWGSECLITDEVLQLFKREAITGFTAEPVTVAKVKRGRRQDAPRLHEVVVTGWGGQASAESGITLIERCPGCGHEKYGPILNWARAIDESKWDGSDLFVVWPAPVYIFATERAADIIERHELTGVRVVPISEAETGYPTSVMDGFTPGTPERWYAPDVAAKRRADFWL